MSAQHKTQRRREDLFLAAVILVAWLAVMGMAANLWLRPWPDILFRSDFVSFWSAGSMVRQGQTSSMFDLEAQRDFQLNLRQETATTDEARAATDHSPYYNAPILAYLFLPLSLLPMPWAYGVWAAINLGMILAAVAIQLRGRRHGAALAAVLLTFTGVAATLFEGQVNGVFALALSLGLLALGAGRPFAGGALLGLIWVKPQYAVLFLLVFVVKRRWREAAGMVTIGLVEAAVSAVAVGPRGVADYLAIMGKINSYYPPIGFRISPEAMSNWRALLITFMPALSETAGSVLVLALAAGTGLLALAAWRGTWDPGSPRFALQMLVTVLATIIASPHSHFHGAVLLLPVLGMVLSQPRWGITASRLWRPLLVLGYLLGLLAFPIRTLSWVFVPLFLVVIVAAVLRPSLSVAHRRSESVGLEA